MTTREQVISGFLWTTNWKSARYTLLAGDASMRKYLRLGRGADGRVAVLMDADPALGNDVGPFVRITNYLRSIDLSAPEIFATDPAQGLLIIEDLGDALFARVVAQDHTLEDHSTLQQLTLCSTFTTRLHQPSRRTMQRS